jgi:hypothetical protein
MVSMAPPLSDMIAEGIKKQIGERLIDMAKTYKNGSYKAGRKERFKGFIDLVGNSVIDIVWANAGQWTMQTANVLYNFDWNKSDKAIQDQIEASHNAMFGVLGGVTATYVARSAGLGAIGSIKNKYPKINVDALADAREDNLDEIRASISGALMAMRSNLATNAFLSSYMTGRHLLGNAPNADKKNEPWILSEKLDDIVEKQQNPAIRSYLTSFKDQAEDAIFDNIALMGNVIQSSYNSHLAALKTEQGPNRVIQITPDSSDSSVKTFVSGSQKQIIEAVETAQIINAGMANKNLGNVVAVEAAQAVKADRNKKIVTIFYRNGPNGASTLSNGNRADEKRLVLHNVKETYDVGKLKPVLENIQGGSYLVTAVLSDGHHATVYAATEGEGKSVLRKLVESACVGNIVKFKVTQPPDEVKLKKPTGDFIPVRVWFTSHREVPEAKKPNWVGIDGKWYQTKRTSVNLLKPISSEMESATRYPWVSVES